MPKAIDLTGNRYGDLTVVRRLGKDRVGAWLWESRCVCGTICVHSSAQLKYRASCGCKTQENRFKTLGRGELHHLSQSVEYHTWTAIKRRCGHLGSGAHPQYAGKGISVCQRWRDSFLAFYEDMGPRPTASHSIDRIDNGGNYDPQNCRWATKAEQSNNRSNTIMVGGVPLAELCRAYGVPRHRAWGRIKAGASGEEIFRPKKLPQIIVVNGNELTVAQCAALLGITRESAYRLHREGRLSRRVLNHDGIRRRL